MYPIRRIKTHITEMCQ